MDDRLLAEEAGASSATRALGGALDGEQEE